MVIVRFYATKATIQYYNTESVFRLMAVNSYPDNLIYLYSQPLEVVSRTAIHSLKWLKITDQYLLNLRPNKS